jgi:hypothetical protein
LWDSNCFEHTQAPYSSNPIVDDLLVDSNMIVKKIYCQDARNKSLRTLEFYEEVHEVLSWCHAHKVALTICSKSPSKTTVETILRTFGIWSWFLHPQVFNSRSKSYHFRNLCEATGLKMRDFIFYDDDPANVSMCTKLGVNCCLVDKTIGLSWKTFVQGLELFQSKQLSHKSFTQWRSSSTTLPSFQNIPIVHEEIQTIGSSRSSEDSEETEVVERRDVVLVSNLTLPFLRHNI